jgi:pilus assembly protein TadC
MDFFTILGKQMPSEWESKAANMLWAAGEKEEPASFLGKVFVLSILLTVISFLFVFLEWPNLTPLLEKLYLPNNVLTELLFALLLSSTLVALLLIILYSWFSLKAEMRRNMLESVLPDFLTLASSNLRSGMSFDEALWNAAKPEFGIFSKEVRASVKEAFSGKPIETALDDLARKFNSPMFQRTVMIIKQSIRTGGELASVLDKLAEDAREVHLVRQDIKTNLLVYTIFLFFASSVGMPFLFAVSLKMVSVLFSVFSISSGLQYGQVLAGVSISAPPITEETFYYFALITLFISTLMTSLIMGSAYEGKITGGIKYIPFMLFITYAIFFLALWALNYVFQNLVI